MAALTGLTSGSSRCLSTRRVLYVWNGPGKLHKCLAPLSHGSVRPLPVLRAVPGVALSPAAHAEHVLHAVHIKISQTMPVKCSGPACASASI